MEQEYTTSTGFKIFYGAVAAFMVGFALFLFSLDHSKAGPAVLLIPIFLLVFAVFIILNQIKSKIIISADYIIRINAFGRKELPCKNIKGIRVGQKTITIEPDSTSNPKIILNNYDDLGNSEELVKWLKENFKDLDDIDLKGEQNKALQDKALGTNPKEREEKLIKAKQIAWTYNIIGMILGFAMIFLKNNLVAAILMLSYPLLGIVVMIFSKGLTKFLSNSKRSVCSFIMLGFIMPAFVMLIKSLGEYEISQYGHIWLPFIVTGLVVFFILFKMGINNSLPLTGQIIFMVIAGFLYGYGSTIQVNCVFDKSSPQMIHTTVSSRWIEHSKGTHYHLKLSSWDTDQTPKDIQVSESTYYRYSEGSSIDVELKKGLLNIPWYYLAE